MKDPKSAPAGSDEEPAASNPESGMIPAPPGYQFPSRKARRHAELTGMIPIIVPGNKTPAVAQTAPGKTDPVPGKSDAGTNPGDKPADTSGGDSPAGDASPGDSPAAVVPAADMAATHMPAGPEDGKQQSVQQPAVAPAPVAAANGKSTTKGKTNGSTKSQRKAAAAESAAATATATPTVGAETSAGANGSPGGEPKLAPSYDSTSNSVTALSSDSTSNSVPAPSPVPAATVTGIPVVPAAQTPVATLPTAATDKAPRTPKAGRDLPAAITVGFSLLVLVIGTLLFYPLGFVALATIFACVGVWEVCRAIAGKEIIAPLTPIMVGALAMPASAYLAGSEGLLFAFVASSAAAVLWRSLDPAPGAIRSILAGLFSLMWIPFLLSFVFLMVRGEQGPTMGLTLDLSDVNPGVIQVMIMLLLVVANDTFGYLVGVLFGKHPMAPKISPKKSWEGFAGSLGGATLVAIPATVFLLDQHWWMGLALAIGMVFAGTGGDFAESMVKRELGVKDMSNLLPGHGGVMDRLDSILFAAPVAYAIFTVLGRF